MRTSKLSKDLPRLALLALLTGLILLLSQSQRDSDIILMLALLLFYP